MQGSFDGERFTFSLFLVLCNRLTTMTLAFIMLMVRGSEREAPGAGGCRGPLLLLPPAGCCLACKLAPCPSAHAGLRAQECHTQPVHTVPPPPGPAAVRPGHAARGAALQLRRRQRVQRGGHLLPVRGAEARVLPHAGGAALLGCAGGPWRVGGEAGARLAAAGRLMLGQVPRPPLLTQPAHKLLCPALIPASADAGQVRQDDPCYDLGNADNEETLRCARSAGEWLGHPGHSRDEPEIVFYAWRLPAGPKDYLNAALITLGCTLFLMTGSVKSKHASSDSSMFGLMLMLGYLGFDGFTSTFQDKLFKVRGGWGAGCSRCGEGRGPGMPTPLSHCRVCVCVACRGSPPPSRTSCSGCGSAWVFGGL